MKKWVVREPIPEEISKEFESQPELVRHLLFYRDIKTKEGAGAFLSPSHELGIHDPFKILGMKRAVDRILKAIEKDERIVIFGDYDADGVCSSVIFHDFFQKIEFENYHVHIPDRYKDGYGLSLKAIDEFISDKTNLIVTLDCGITNCEEVEKANEAGVDVIIIDHHLIPEKKPNAFAIVDLKQEGDEYPFRELSGAGIAFKTVQALVRKGGFKIVPGWERWLLDAVAIATIADMVPLANENRVLTHWGLFVLRKTRRWGLLSLCRRLNMSMENITEDDVGFLIAPRINTASRMGHANTSFNLMTTQSQGEANWISGHLDGMNNERKVAVTKILEAIEERIDAKNIPEIIIEGDVEWFPGVLGIAANRLIDKYRRPVFLWGQGESKDIKGSCRALPENGVNLVELMKGLPDEFLNDAGGHVLAGGFSIEVDKGEKLKKELLKVFKEMPQGDKEEPVLVIDKELSIDDVDWSLYGQVEKFQPFGKGNPKPIFLFSGVTLDSVKTFGNGGIHLRLGFEQASGKKLSAIGFFIAGSDKFSGLEEGQKIDLAANLEKSTYRNYPELRLRIVDVKASS